MNQKEGRRLRITINIEKTTDNTEVKRNLRRHGQRYKHKYESSLKV